jgi:short-subunit dehydrogenase
MAVYHATKAYVISFSEALHRELAPKGVKVTVLCPGPVETDFRVRADGFFTRMMIRASDRVARDGYAGLMQGRRMVVPGFENRLLLLLTRVLPRRLMMSFVAASKRKPLDADSG